MVQIEGRRPVLEALRAGRPVRRVLVSSGTGHSPVVDEILALASARGVEVERVSPRSIAERARTRAPQGVVALAETFQYSSLEDLLCRSTPPPLFVALDGVTDPQNVGAIARSAHAFGADGLLVPARRGSGVTPAAEKAAAGAFSRLCVARVSSLERALRVLRSRGVWVVALDPSGSLRVADLELATDPLCLVIGSEGRGVSRLVRDRSDAVVRIPIQGGANSLNASAAAAVALYEVARRRASTLLGS